MPDHETAIALIRASGRAIAAPSANPFGYVSPTEAGHVAALLTGVDLILDGGRCKVGVESSILSLAGSRPLLLRAGGAAPEDLERITGPLGWSTDAAVRPDAPGQLSRHYATRTPLQIIAGQSVGNQQHPGERVGLITMLPPLHPERYEAVEVLSPTGDLREAAANLFAALHRLDRLGLDRLIARPVPAVGLGIAIMDRLRRCSSPESGAAP
jgi:L-threonylcarbamoyladenylate synthase